MSPKEAETASVSILMIASLGWYDWIERGGSLNLWIGITGIVMFVGVVLLALFDSRRGRLRDQERDLK